MSPSISTNLLARNAAAHVGEHYDRLATSMRRLSSGLRVNTAADDAAGLAIRELMRTNIAGLQQGVRNANDAISMIQTADGALSVIDEKLIRMTELAEQAATGTYDSTQRLIIDSEFQAMAQEIDRIANATDFNGIKLLDGSMNGEHDGSGLTSTGKLKVHFGTGNDSAEDYYYVGIGNCTLAGLGLRDNAVTTAVADAGGTGGGVVTRAAVPTAAPRLPVTVNDYDSDSSTILVVNTFEVGAINAMLPEQGVWYDPNSWWPGGEAIIQNFMFTIPKGAKNIVINTLGIKQGERAGDQDIQLFTKSGVHLAGTSLDDIVYTKENTGHVDNSITGQSARLGFTQADYNNAHLNTGPSSYDPTGATLRETNYNGMTIGYSGDPDRHDATPNDGGMQTWDDYEVLTIDEATEDLVFWMVGQAGAGVKAYWDTASVPPPAPLPPPGPNPDLKPGPPAGDIISIDTQEKAQQALERLDDAMVAKDGVRAHLGALQNRLENTVTNLSVQAENLQAAESRISDVDVAVEMTAMIRNQILAQSSTSMLAQANALPQMLVELIG